ncbi:FAD/FMN-containing dehydrogenase [Pseudonocardia hierapolitana]|uniref:FAD/FMN-containing dehydrogenase n=1 Tax=Pseudonocardia hierapolitana TaxID=1128676 RepID=A0A561T1K4_9PSEU|nr:FAD/FMN-containing dehydrogenase [Pseudonocardia hierapolitana]
MAGVTDLPGGVPPLDGSLHVDLTTRTRYAGDAGRISSGPPAAVLRPGSAADVARMVRYCRRHGVPVGARGLGNTTGGQSLVPGGVVIDASALAGIRTFGPGGATVGAGTTWLELARAAARHGLAIPAATGYLGLTVGGTLSVGGIPPAVATGAQVDHVHELEVVTGDGELRRCSPSDDRDLFEAVLAGLGQFGIITEATVGLVPAPAVVRGWSLPHADPAAFFGGLRALARGGEATEVFGDWWRPGEAGEVHHLNAFAFDPADGAPDPPPGAEVREAGYLEHVTRIDDAVAELRELIGWDALPKPWLTVWLPDSRVEEVVGATLAELTPADVGVGGFVLLYTHRRAALTRPSLRLPAPDGSDLVHLFTVMTAGPPDAGPGYGAAMLRRNRRMLDRALAAGGARYPIGTVTSRPADWHAHYGERWPHLVALRQRYDPAGILTPGHGVFLG